MLCGSTVTQSSLRLSIRNSTPTSRSPLLRSRRVLRRSIAFFVLKPKHRAIVGAILALALALGSGAAVTQTRTPLYTPPPTPAPAHPHVAATPLLCVYWLENNRSALNDPAGPGGRDPVVRVTGPSATTGSFGADNTTCRLTLIHASGMRETGWLTLRPALRWTPENYVVRKPTTSSP